MEYLQLKGRNYCGYDDSNIDEFYGCKLYRFNPINGIYTATEVNVCHLESNTDYTRVVTELPDAQIEYLHECNVLSMELYRRRQYDRYAEKKMLYEHCNDPTFAKKLEYAKNMGWYTYNPHLDAYDTIEDVIL
jgi:hypothetical protein